MQKNNQALMVVIVIGLLVVGGYWYMSSNQSASVVSPSPISESTTIIVASPASSVKPAPSPVVDKNMVSITKNTFVPGTMSIKVGETVTWVNNDTYAHDIVADDQTFVSKSLAQGEKYSYTFMKAGTFNYICNIHPSMKGIVIVTN